MRSRSGWRAVCAAAAVSLVLAASCGGDGSTPPGDGSGASGDQTPGRADATTLRAGDADVGAGGEVVSLRPDEDTAGPGPGPSDAATTDGDTGPGLPDADHEGCAPGEPCQLTNPIVCKTGICNAVGLCDATDIPGCCASDSDCDGIIPTHPCGTIQCVTNKCTAVTAPGCCADASECDDGHDCTDELCSGPGGHCANCPTTCACPAATAVFATDFSGTSMQSLGLIIADQQTVDDVTWQLDTHRWVRPPSSAYLGDPTCRTYFSGTLGPDCQPAADDAQQVRVSFYTPALILPDIPGGHVATWWVLSDVEPPKTGGAGDPDVLQVTVEVPGTGASIPITSTLDVGKSTSGAWRLMGADLSPWRGQTIQLRFTFDTFDGTSNHHEGVYVDELEVVPRCLGGCCDTDDDCADLPAPDGTCDEVRCVGLTDGGFGVCAATPIAPGSGCTACSGDDDCLDDNPCTADSCTASGVCSHITFCCFEQTALQDGFEAGLAAWFVADTDPTDTVTWQSTTTSAIEGAAAAWLGDPATGTYEVPGPNGEGLPLLASLTSPATTLPATPDPAASLGATFWLRLETEWDGAFYDNPLGIDRLRLEVIQGGQATEVWSSDEVGGTTSGVWTLVEVDLDPWVDASVQLRFTFDTVDGHANAFGGPYLDDFRLGSFCP